MGWLFKQGFNYADLIRDRIRHQEGTDKNGVAWSYNCIAHCIRGRVLWTVWEIVKTTKTGEPETTRFIGCDLLGKERDYGAGYKDLCESVHPFEYSCPLPYLDMVPVACEKWREGVRAYHAKRAARNSLMKIGQTVKLIDGCKLRNGAPISEATITSLRPLRCSAGPYTSIRMHRRLIKLEGAEL